jgi:hypothetical protein
LAGGVLALLPKKEIPHQTATWMELFGIALILIPMASYSQGAPGFPGLAAAPPVLGTVLIIAADNRGHWIAPLLRQNAVQFVGLISYSLYIWHLPVIVFSRIIWPAQGTMHTAAAMALSAALAYLSFRVVEKPFRNERHVSNRAFVIGFASTAAGVAMLAAASLTSSAQNAQIAGQAFLKSFLFDEQTARAMSAVNTSEIDYQANLNINFSGTSGVFSRSSHSEATCSYDSDNTPGRITECLTKQSETKNNILVIGDSHGRDTVHALKLAYPAINFTMLHQSGCQPADFQFNEAVRCFHDLEGILDEYLSKIPVDGIILSFRYRPKEWRNVENGIELLAKYKLPLFLVGPRPVYGVEVADWLRQAPPFRTFPLEVSADQLEMLPWNIFEIDDDARRYAATKGVEYISVIGSFCNKDSCRLFDGDPGTPIIWDESHLTRHGIALLANHIRNLNIELIKGNAQAEETNLLEVN